VTAVRFLTDEHVAGAVVLGLRSRGAEVVSAREICGEGADDAVILAAAHSMRCVVITQDADFLRLAQSGIPHAGIVYAPQHTPVGTLVRGLVLIFHVLSAEDMAGHIEFL
jgi:Domain of unknown function (DUF5615)